MFKKNIVSKIQPKRSKLDNKGIAISGVMYMILIVCLLLILGTLKTMQNRKVTINKLKSDTIEELEDSITTLKVASPSTVKFLGGGVDHSKYESVTTVSSNKVPSDAIDSWDVSEDQNGKIMAWYLDEDNDNMYELYIGQDGGVIANPNSSYLFYQFRKATNMDLSNLNTSNVTDMSHMFECYLNSGLSSKVTILDLSGWDTSNVTDMSYMFRGMDSLISLDVSHFDTSNVTNMSHMFMGMDSLISLDVSHFDTSNVTDMSYMFREVKKVTSLDVSHFDTSNVTNMTGMFEIISLTSLDLSNFDTSNVTNMNGMFSGCTSLTSLDLSNFNTSKVTDMSYMFYGTTSLTSLDLSSFDTSNVTNMNYMFCYSSKLTSLDLSHFDTSNVTNMSSMFKGTTSLTTLNMKSANFTKVTSYGDMFLSSKVSTIYVKDSTARTFINSRLSDVGLSATVRLS